ncbi:stromelysin-3 [Spea bombifrons]|uniref:stromelysin-3 n=1 Tax=Spea bombifrons TaxID=233779 RepID=UPI00234AD56A|nr:stromelysin-3 [Spea bombifrons]
MYLLIILPALYLLGVQAVPLPQRSPYREQDQTWKEQSRSWIYQPRTKGLLSAQNSVNPPRCGVPDMPFPPDSFNGRNRKKRFVLSGGRWDKTNLTYKIIRFPWQLSKLKVRRTLAEALKVWSDVTPLNFTEVFEGRADIIIDFTRYWHGDNLPFDGPGGILAHAFFPKTHREGDVHFDYDEAWTIGSNLGTDLLQVAAHEFGHVLGLQHSSVSKSLMSPFYTFRYPLSLSADDKHGIQYLYGAPRPLTPEPTVKPEPKQPENESNEIPTSEPNACYTGFDAVSAIRGELFFFKSGYVWRLRGGKLQSGYPALASRHWKGIPETVDAAFEDSAGNIWFFHGTQFWVFDGKLQASGPHPLSNLGLSVPQIQAVLIWGTDKNKKVFLFRGAEYWRFNPDTWRVEIGYPRSMGDWRGVPTSIDAAFQDEQGFAYFLRGQYYWKFDPIQVRVLESYPRRISQDFFSCAVTPTSANALR